MQGLGLHLSANSISYARGPAAPVYLWDEQVGHHLWFVGLALLLGVVVAAVRDVAVPVGARSTAIAVLVGLTWAANLVEGGAVWLGALLAVALGTVGWRLRRRPVGVLLLMTVGVAGLLVAGYGAWQSGYPQPSELGWL